MTPTPLPTWYPPPRRDAANRETITLPPDGRPDAEQPAWRQDFPIDWPQDVYVARRDFTKFMVLTSLAFVVGQAWIGVMTLLRRREKPAAMKVASLEAVPVGGSVTFKYPGPHDDCVLVRTGPGSGTAGLVAYGQKCTHLSCAVVPRVGEGCLGCPCHEGSFDLATGRPIAGPPRRPLPKVTLEVRGNDVYATGVEERTV